MDRGATPAAQGFRLVPDSAAAARHWLAWPQRGEPPVVRDTVLALAALLSEQAPVTILARSAELAEVSLRCPPGVTAMQAAPTGARLKPSAPLFLRRPDDGQVAALRPASGEAESIIDHLGCPAFDAPAWLRPDWLEADGTGLLLASRSLLAAGAEDEVAAWLRDLTGTERVVWLDSGQAGPAAPVGAVARCLAPGVAMAMVEIDAADPNYLPLRENVMRLQNAGFTVAAVPQPRRRAGDPPAALTACVVTRRHIVLPAFEQSCDDIALEAVSTLLPDRKVELEPARELAAAGYELSGLVCSQPAER